MGKNFVTERLNNPEWEKATKVHDWRNHVPEQVQEMWCTFSIKQREALYNWARNNAENEEWD